MNQLKKRKPGEIYTSARWITEERDLQETLRLGLSDLFRDVFGEPPYNEVFEPGEVDEIFKKYLDQNANILFASSNFFDLPVAFMVGMSLSNEFKKVANMPPILFERKTGYIAEDGVCKNWRRRGLSNKMKEIMLNQMREQNYELVVLRTRADNTPQIAAVTKAGGTEIPCAQQFVTRNTKFGTVKEDNRFFLFDLRPK